jgi:homoaconitase/3-isopropylmalate dehydratase large subunit
MKGLFQNTSFTANGIIENILGYAVDDELLTGKINVSADKINLNNWLSTDTAATTSASTTSTEPFLVPANLNINLNATAGMVVYDKVTYNNVRGSLLLKDETVSLQNIQTEALDGSMLFDGWYSTKTNKHKPDININYTVKDIDVQKAFFAYNTIQKLMPLGKFLSGKLNSQFTMRGNLNADMFPDLNSLTGKGNLLLIEGVLKKFQPLDKLSSILSVSELKDISLKDIKSHFEFANGKVLIKPFNINVKDIDMQVGGMHGIDQSIDYIVAMKLPRKYMGNNGNTLINDMASAANNKVIQL